MNSHCGCQQGVACSKRGFMMMNFVLIEKSELEGDEDRDGYACKSLCMRNGYGGAKSKQNASRREK